MIRKDLDNGDVLIGHRSHKMADAVTLCRMITQLHKEGYEFAEPATPRECPVIPLVQDWRFTKASNQDPLKGIRSKADLLAFATRHEIEIPEDKQKQVVTIRQFIKDTLNGKEIEE